MTSLITNLSSYGRTIFYSVLLFIPIAAVIALPFMVIQYRRYRRIPILRVLLVFGFIFYMECSFLLTVLPLPSVESVATSTDQYLQLIPFSTYANAFRSSGLSFSQPDSLLSFENWETLLTSANLFEILANIVMQIPLGIFLRYYFGCSLKKTILIGFLVSLFYELIQLSGLFFLYPRPYRLCSVDDLIDNTLGAVIGYILTPLFCALLPSRKELDEQSIGKTRRLTLMHRVTAALVDWVIFLIAVVLIFLLFPNKTLLLFGTIAAIAYLPWVFIFFVFIQYFLNGSTPGKMLLRIKVRNLTDGRNPGLLQYLIPNFY